MCICMRMWVKVSDQLAAGQSAGAAPVCLSQLRWPLATYGGCLLGRVEGSCAVVIMHLYTCTRFTCQLLFLRGSWHHAW
jgi:hypothetical protein